jgi:hypothetical protein
MENMQKVSGVKTLYTIKSIALTPIREEGSEIVTEFRVMCFDKNGDQTEVSFDLGMEIGKASMIHFGLKDEKHQICDVCGLCKTCGSCQKMGCGDG